MVDKVPRQASKQTAMVDRWTKVEDLFHMRWWLWWRMLGRYRDCVSKLGIESKR